MKGCGAASSLFRVLLFGCQFNIELNFSRTSGEYTGAHSSRRCWKRWGAR
jgi:hypothetical protein